MTTGVQDLVDRAVAGGVPGAVALLDRPGRPPEVAAAGEFGRDAIVRLASVSKPILAAAVLTLIEDGTLRLSAPVAEWLPELADLRMLRDPAGPLTDTVPADRPVTVAHLLDSTPGWGYPSDFEVPFVAALADLQRGMDLHALPAPDEWLRRLAEAPLYRPPGTRWLYNLASDLQGCLVARATGRPLADVLTERIFEPAGMVDTGFALRPDQVSRMTTSYRPSVDGLEVVDRPDGAWTRQPAFPSGAAGLLSTVADVHRFFAVLRGRGELDGRRLLAAESVAAMTRNQISAEQAAESGLFLDGQGWGYGGCVDLTADGSGAVPGRYGWIGGTGTSAHLLPDGTITVLLTQVEMTEPTAPAIVRGFWALAAAPA